MTSDQRVNTLSAEIFALEQQKQQLDSISKTLDEAFTLPGTQIRIGWDALIGLIPVAGDIAGALASAFFLWRGIQLRIPRWQLMRMGVNVGIETLIGLIPIVGDIFDTQWRANRRNYHILAQHLDRQISSLTAELAEERAKQSALTMAEEKSHPETAPDAFWLWFAFVLVASMGAGYWLYNSLWIARG